MDYSKIVGLIALISCFISVWLVYTSKKNANILNVVMTIVLTFSTAGYFLMSISKTLEGNAVANAVTGIGTVFLPMLVLFALADLSENKMPKWFIGYIVFINVVLYMTVLMSIIYPFYYNDFKLMDVTAGSIGTDLLGIPGKGFKIITVPGTGAKIHLIIISVEVILAIFFTLITIFGKKNASKKTMWVYLMMMLMTVTTFIFERTMEVKYEVMPFMYLISNFAILVLNARVLLYDVSTNIQARVTESTGYGYITFDKKFNYVGCNKVAMDIFPDLKVNPIDTPINTDDYVLRELMRWMKKNVENPNPEEPKIHTDMYKSDRGQKRHLQIDLSFIRFGINKRIMGYILELNDDTQQNNYIHELSFQGVRFKQEADRQTKRNKSLQSSTILGMASMIESRDNSTGGHINRTSSCVALFVDELRARGIYVVSDSFWTNVVNAAPLHDLGKIAVDDYILRKPTAFTEEEYEKMKTHAAEGAKIVAKVLADVDDREFVKIAVNVAHYHHEKFNGTGYPDQLVGEEIPLEARIMALADVFDALASKRYYKEPMSYDQAFMIIAESIGSHFDPKLANVFIDIKDRIVELYETFEGTEYHR